MRIAVISDLHGNLAATEAVLGEIDSLESGADTIICTGDVVGHAAHPNEVIDLLRAREISTVRGNYDDFVIGRRENSGKDYPSTDDQRADEVAVSWTKQALTPESKGFLQNLRGDARLDVTRGGMATGRVRASDSDAKRQRNSVLGMMIFGTALSSMGRQPKTLRPRKLLFVHGSPRDSIEYLYPDTATSIFQTIGANADADVVVHGHSHQPYQRQVGDVAFVGVGSVGRPRIPGIATFAVLDAVNLELAVDFHSVDYDFESEARAVEKAGLPDQLAEYLRKGQPVLGPAAS